MEMEQPEWTVTIGVIGTWREVTAAESEAEAEERVVSHIETEIEPNADGWDEIGVKSLGAKNTKEMGGEYPVGEDDQETFLVEASVSGNWTATVRAPSERAAKREVNDQVDAQIDPEGADWGDVGTQVKEIQRAS